MKRKLTLFLSAVMATSCLPMTAYAANFKDIKDVPWAGAADVINSVADLGLLSGYEDGTFRARNNVTYCEAMQMVYNALIKTGATSGIDAVDAYSYMAVLNTYKVPSWCQMAVAYGLHNGIIDMQMVATKFSGGTQAATREDVALMFGNALGMFYDKDKTAATVSEFVDHWSITSDTAVQIDLLKRLGVVSGDEYNRFNPKKNINRAEMAVMLNKTNSILTEGVSSSGEITELQVNSTGCRRLGRLQCNTGRFPRLCRQYKRNHFPEQAERRGPSSPGTQRQCCNSTAPDEGHNKPGQI